MTTTPIIATIDSSAIGRLATSIYEDVFTDVEAQIAATVEAFLDATPIVETTEEREASVAYLIAAVRPHVALRLQVEPA